MRACSGTRADVCKVRSCPLLQDTVRTEATDIGMRCHGPKITPSAIWKTKMYGRIQLTSFQLSQQLACSLCYSDPLLAARGCRWFILLKIRCHPPKALSPGYLFLLSYQSLPCPSTTAVCSVNCTSENKFKMLSFSSHSSPLPSLRLFFSTVISGIYVSSALQDYTLDEEFKLPTEKLLPFPSKSELKQVTLKQMAHV